MRILIIEDDFTWFDLLRTDLEGRYKGVEIERIATESELASRIVGIDLQGYDIALIDLIIRFDSPPAIGIEQADRRPSNYAEIGGRFMAGVRCAQRLREEGLLCPVILYSASARPSALDSSSLSDITFLKKDQVDRWFQKINELVAKP
tara:strand:+ start:1052 stop:1495 length:444 start_codon:yes stop_codon:yes gene_type:complete